MVDSKEEILSPLISDSSKLAAEFRKRKKEYRYKAVSPKNASKLLEDGWEHDRKLKKTVRLKKLKSIDERLENKVWCLFYNMGYTDMNEGRGFKVTFNRPGGKKDKRQIDVFAKDDETILFVECKASESLRLRRLQSEIDSLANIKGYLANAAKKYYDGNYKPKILWLFVTENIRWSSSDKLRAESENIQIITDRQFRYFSEIVKLLGSAAKYQFLAEFLKNQKIPELKNRIIPAIRGKLGGKKVYCFVTTPKQLLKIAFINHRAMDDPEGYPTYQRLVDKNRRKKIGRFLEKGGFFPTNLLINFQRKVRFDASIKDDDSDIHFGQLYLPDKYKSAWIVDGQHRLYGYSGLDEKFLKQNIMVLAFEKLPRVEEADIFVTINHEQKSVPRNLLDDLEGDLKWGSDKPTERIGAISARLIKILNADIGEPFYNRITAQGIRVTNQTCLTVPEIKDGIKKSGLIGAAILKRRVYEPGPLCSYDDEATLKRARIALNLYFSLVRDSSQKRWEEGRGGFLCTNPGVRGLFLLLAALLKHVEEKKHVDLKKIDAIDLIGEIEKYLVPVFNFFSNASDNKMEDCFKVKYGSGGAPQYYFRLVQLVNKKFTDFKPEGFVEFLESQSTERIKKADQIVRQMQTIVPSFIFNKFRDIYGPEHYLEKGVTDVEMRTQAYKKQQSEDISIRAPELEAYFEFIQLKKIVEKKKNWPVFKDVFNIPLPENKGLDKKAAWMERINELRRISAHGYKRQYKVDDFAFLDWILDEFVARVESSKSKDGVCEQGNSIDVKPKVISSQIK